MDRDYFRKRDWQKVFCPLFDWSAKKTKVSAILILIAAQVYSTTFAQRITLNVKNATLESVIREVRKQGKVQIVYNSDLMRGKMAPRLNIKDATVNQVLQRLLQDAELDYVIDNNTVVIKPKSNVGNKSNSSVAQQQFIAAGTVMDSSGRVLPGVSIKETGTTNATTSNNNGEFALRVTGNATTLDFSFIGFLNVEKVMVSEDMKVVLQEDDTELEEVVVVGYGEQRKLSVVSSVSSVKGESLKFPTRNLSNNIAGQVAGLIAVQRSGEPGYDNSEFWIRGVSSFAGGTLHWF